MPTRATRRSAARADAAARRAPPRAFPRPAAGRDRQGCGSCRRTPLANDPLEDAIARASQVFDCRHRFRRADGDKRVYTGLFEGARLLPREQLLAAHDSGDRGDGTFIPQLPDGAERIEHGLMVVTERVALAED